MHNVPSQSYFNLNNGKIDVDENTRIQALHDYMTNNHLPVYLVNYGQVAANKDYPVYINAPETMPYNLMIIRESISIIEYIAFRASIRNAGMNARTSGQKYLTLSTRGMHYGQNEAMNKL